MSTVARWSSTRAPKAVRSIESDDLESVGRPELGVSCPGGRVAPNTVVPEEPSADVGRKLLWRLRSVVIKWRLHLFEDPLVRYPLSPDALTGLNDKALGVDCHECFALSALMNNADELHVRVTRTAGDDARADACCGRPNPIEPGLTDGQWRRYRHGARGGDGQHPHATGNQHISTIRAHDKFVTEYRAYASKASSSG